MTNFGPSDPVFISKILQVIQEILWGHLWNILFFISENLKLWNCWKVCVPNFSNFDVLVLSIIEMWEFRTFEILRISKVAWTFGIWESWQFEKWKSQRWAPENDEDPRNKIYRILWLVSYRSNTWDGHLVTFLLSSKGTRITPQHSDSQPCIRPRWYLFRSIIFISDRLSLMLIGPRWHSIVGDRHVERGVFSLGTVLYKLHLCVSSKQIESCSCFWNSLR